MDLENKKIRTLSILSKLIEDAHRSGMYSTESDLSTVREFIKDLDILHFRLSLDNYTIARYPENYKSFLNDDLCLSIAEQLADKLNLSQTHSKSNIISLSDKSDYYTEFGIMINKE